MAVPKRILTNINWEIGEPLDEDEDVDMDSEELTQVIEPSSKEIIIVNLPGARKAMKIVQKRPITKINLLLALEKYFQRLIENKEEELAYTHTYSPKTSISYFGTKKTGPAVEKEEIAKTEALGDDRNFEGLESVPGKPNTWKIIISGGEAVGPYFKPSKLPNLSPRAKTAIEEASHKRLHSIPGRYPTSWDSGSESDEPILSSGDFTDEEDYSSEEDYSDGE